MPKRPADPPLPFNDAPLLLAYDRLLAAVAYCRKRLRRPEYEAELERILAGERDERIANPDRTPIAHG